MIPKEVSKILDQLLETENKYRKIIDAGKSTDYEDGFLGGVLYASNLIKKVYREIGEDV